MAIPYLKISPEEAVALLQDSVVKGYILKDKINNEYEKLRVQEVDVINAGDSWNQQYLDWRNSTIAELERGYVSLANAYNFRDATSMYVITGNARRSDIVTNINAKIEKLNEYVGFILAHIDGKLEINGDIVLRDKITVEGDHAKVKTRN